MQAPNYFISSLAQTLNVGGNDTSIQLSTIYTQDGQVVTTSDFATFGRGIITINPLSISSVEFASFTGITAGTSPAGTLTGTLRGLSFKSNTQIPANQKFNVVGTAVIISFGTHNIQDIIDYIDNAVVGGGVPATTTVLGIVKLSAPPTSGPSPVAISDTDYRLNPNNGAASATGTDAYAITLSNAPTSYAKGQQFWFQADVANTGAATLNVNGLGIKTIKKNVSADLATGDILASQIVVVEYDGSNMQIISLIAGVKDATQLTGLVPAASLSVLATTAGTGNGPAASSTQTITHGLGRTPKVIRINSFFTQGNSTISQPMPTSLGVFNSSGNHCIYFATVNAGTGANPALDNSNSVSMQQPVGVGATALINNVGATTFDIVWTVNNSVVTGVYIWEAE